MAAKEKTFQNVGKLLEIKGVVVDALFTERLPGINTALEIEIAGADGEAPRKLVAEVQQHLGDDRVRAVAMDSTDGLARGTDVVDTGAPITVPVGDPTLGRLWNVVGDASTSRTSRRRTSSAGRSTATRRRSASCRRRWRPSRPG